MFRTDHGSLQWLHNIKEPERQLARWLERLQEYYFEIQHRKGSQHQNADALSRYPENKSDKSEISAALRPSMDQLKPLQLVAALVVYFPEISKYTRDDIKQLLQADDDFGLLWQSVEK